MKLWFSSLLLLVELFLSSSGTTYEECKPMITPKATFKPDSSVLGKWTWILGYSDNPVNSGIYSSIHSKWVEYKAITSDPKHMIEDEGVRHPLNCKFATTPLTFVDNFAISQKSNISRMYRLLPTCDNCLLLHITGINTQNLFAHTDPTSLEQLTIHSTLALLTKDGTISDENLEHTKKQAACMGFTGEPSFHYNSKHTLCEKDQQ